MKIFLIQKWKKCQKGNKLLLFFILLLTTNIISAQKVVKVKDIKGMAFITGDVSPNQAQVLALNDAKINALKAAGVGENIKSYQMLFNSQAKNEYSQFFHSDIQSEIQGAVQNYEVKKQATIQKNEIELYIEVTIDASIIKYETKPDYTFDVNIEGVKSVYNNNDNCIFSVAATQLCYLTVFDITDSESSLLYPNSYEKQIPIKAGELYKFPNANIEYGLECKKCPETNRFIFVFTKTQIPFIKIDKDQLTNNDAIFNWIYSIMPDQRKVEYRALTIQN